MSPVILDLEQLHVVIGIIEAPRTRHDDDTVEGYILM